MSDRPGVTVPKEERRLNGRRCCKFCKRTKPLSDFYQGMGHKCYECKKAHVAAWQKNRYANATRFEARTWKRGQGTKEEILNVLEELYDGQCQICRRPLSVEEANIDHDYTCHPRGKFCINCIRGILCNGCNVGLGTFRDKPEALLEAFIYLTCWNEGNA